MAAAGIPGKVHDWASPQPGERASSSWCCFRVRWQSSRLGKPSGTEKRAGQSSQVLVYMTSMLRAGQRQSSRLGNPSEKGKFYFAQLA